MFIERPPLLYRLLFPEAVWRVKGSRREALAIPSNDRRSKEDTL